MLVCAAPGSGECAEIDVGVLGQRDVRECGGDDGGVGAAALEQTPHPLAELASVGLHERWCDRIGAPGGVDGAAAHSAAIRSAINVHRGRLVQAAVAAAFGLPCEKLAA